MTHVPAEKKPHRVLLLGVDTPIGLTLIRELAEHSVEVHGVARSPWGIGLFSRHLASGVVISGRGTEQRERILSRMRALDIDCLMAISEVDLLWLNAERKHFAGIHLLVPADATLRAVLDKTRVLNSAHSLGIAIPTSFTPSSPEDALTQTWQYPLILKWADPNEVAPTLGTHGLELLKAEYIYDADQLRTSLERYRPLGVYPLVQQFCPGYGLGQMFVMHQGNALLAFQHRRVHEWPPEGGVSSVCESVGLDEHAELQKLSMRLLQDLAWDGPAMVEYRFDPATGKAVLMEINGRFWGSLPLTRHAGAHFGWTTYRALYLGDSTREVRGYRSGVRCAFMIPEMKRLLRIITAPGKIQNRSLHFSPLAEVGAFLLLLLNPRTRYYVFSLADPLPMLADLFGAVFQRLKFKP